MLVTPLHWPLQCSGMKLSPVRLFSKFLPPHRSACLQYSGLPQPIVVCWFHHSKGLFDLVSVVCGNLWLCFCPFGPGVVWVIPFRPYLFPFLSVWLCLFLFIFLHELSYSLCAYTCIYLPCSWQCLTVKFWAGSSAVDWNVMSHFQAHSRQIKLFPFRTCFPKFLDLLTSVWGYVVKDSKSVLINLKFGLGAYGCESTVNISCDVFSPVMHLSSNVSSSPTISSDCASVQSLFFWCCVSLAMLVMLSLQLSCLWTLIFELFSMLNVFICNKIRA